MRVSPGGRFEGHGADRAFVEDLTVGALRMRLEGSDISKDHTTVDTSEDEQEKKG